MADPATIALIVGIGGTVMGAVSQYQAGKEEAAQHRMNAAIAAKNAALAKAEAERKRQISREVAREQRREKRANIARAIVLYAKTGLKVWSPTAGLVLGEIERRGEKKATITQESGVWDWQYGMSQADIYQQQAGYYGRVAESVRKRSLWGAGATLATGLSSSLMGAYQFRAPTTTSVSTLSTARKTVDWRKKTSPWTYGRHF